MLKYFMPELPEVETTIRYLRPIMVGKKIESLHFSPKAGSIFNLDLNEVASKLTGSTATEISRRGKFMLFDLDKTKAVGHLRMSGRYLASDSEFSHPHSHFTLILEDGQNVNYIDQRRFGTFHFVDDFGNYPGLRRLGPDALLDDIDPGYLFDRFKSKNTTIYQALLDQSIIAGLGNIYVNELLFSQKIHPLTPAKVLSQSQLSNLASSIKPLLEKALALKGTTLVDNLYQDPEGKVGEFAKMLNVYGRNKEVCKACGKPISKIRIGGRGVYLCEECQKGAVIRKL